MVADFSSLLGRYVAAGQVAGAAVGMLQRGQMHLFADGCANLNSGTPMTIDTRWLLGSVTKVLTAQLVLQFANAGHFDLDDPVQSIIGDFTLQDKAAASQITFRHLISHMNGIDSDTYAPHTDDYLYASQHYLDGLRGLGVLFTPGQNVHYSNPGFIIAARILEIISGRNFNQLLEQDLFGPLGMAGSTTRVEEAALHNLAIGAFADGDGLRATPNLLSEACGAGAGTTAITTLEDMLCYASHHLLDGKDGGGIDRAIVAAMAAQQLVSPRVTAVMPGLGWWINDVGGHKCLSHGGGSPGGVSHFVVIPSLDLALISFATGPGAVQFHDDVLFAALGDLSIDVPVPQFGQPSSDLSAFAGVYGGFQARHDVVVDGGGLTMISSVPPYDAEHEQFLRNYYGGLPAPVTRRLVPFGRDCFVVEGTDPTVLAGLLGNAALYGFERDLEGTVMGMRNGARYSRKEVAE